MTRPGKIVLGLWLVNLVLAFVTFSRTMAAVTGANATPGVRQPTG